MFPGQVIFAAFGRFGETFQSLAEIDECRVPLPSVTRETLSRVQTKIDAIRLVSTILLMLAVMARNRAVCSFCFHVPSRVIRTEVIIEGAKALCDNITCTSPS